MFDLAKVQHDSAKEFVERLFFEHATGEYSGTILGTRALSADMVQYGLMSLCMGEFGHSGFGDDRHRPLIESILDELVSEGKLVRSSAGFQKKVHFNPVASPFSPCGVQLHDDERVALVSNDHRLSHITCDECLAALKD